MAPVHHWPVEVPSLRESTSLVGHLVVLALVELEPWQMTSVPSSGPASAAVTLSHHGWEPVAAQTTNAAPAAAPRDESLLVELNNNNITMHATYNAYIIYIHIKLYMYICVCTSMFYHAQEYKENLTNSILNTIKLTDVHPG